MLIFRRKIFVNILTLALMGLTSLWAKPAVADENGKLPCQFSVSATQKVQFSQGNLQYQASTGTWRFAENQYDFVGDASSGNVYENSVKCNNANISSTYTGWIDLFGWATSGNSASGTRYQPWESSTVANQYGNLSQSGAGEWDASKSDWGQNMTGTWRTLTKDEWVFLINQRTNASSLRTLATVNSVPGLIIMPDGWTASIVSLTITTSNYTSNNINLTNWRKLEEQGCVILPAAGRRSGMNVNVIGLRGFYWSSSASDTNQAYNFAIGEGVVSPSNYFDRNYGYSVRLVQDATGDAPTASVTTAPEGQTISFDNTSHELVSAGTASGGTMMYSLDNVTFSTAIPTASAIGTYIVYYYAEGAGCFASSAVSSVTAKIEAAVYDNADPTATLTTLNNSGNPEPTNLTVYRTIYRNGEYNTICLPFALDASALAASPLAGFNNLKTIKGASISGTAPDLSIDIFVEDVTEMEAGKPYLISYPSANENIVNPVFTDITVTETSPGSVTADGITFRGMFAQVHIDPYTNERDEDYLFLGANSQLMWPNDDGSSMRGFRAYFIIDRNAIPAQVAPRGTHARFVNAPKQPTAIENTELNTQAQKLLENGQLIILKNGIKYNAQGQVLK